MTTAINSAISPFAQPKTGPNANANRFLDEKLASVPASGISEEFRKLSRYVPVLGLVPRSALHDATTQKKPGLEKSVTRLVATRDVCVPLDAAQAWLRNPNAQATF